MLYYNKKREVRLKMKKTKFKFKNYTNVVASLAMMFSFMAINSRCVCIFHQPKMPNELRKLKRD